MNDKAEFDVVMAEIIIDHF